MTLASRRGEASVTSSPMIAFLDVNFGVLGIFLVIFALRIVVLEQGGRADADFTVFLFDEPAPGMVWHGREAGHEGMIEELGSAGAERMLASFLKKGVELARRSVRLRVWVDQGGIDAENELRRALERRISTSAGDDFVSFSIDWRPLANDADRARIIADWRDRRDAERTAR